MAFTRTEDHLEVGRKPNTVVTDVQPEDRFQAVDSSQLTQRIQHLYSIALVDTSTSEVLRTGGIVLDPAAAEGSPRPGNKAEFFFSVPPKVVDVTEPFSTTIVPTQNGGKFVESHGSIIKSVRVQGTTGLRPNKRVPQAIDLLRDLGVNLAGIPQQNPFDRQGIPEGEATGWDDIMFLRNIFRLYSDIKEGREEVASARNVVMVWRNAKDLDFWIVEPGEFKMTASSNSPFTYSYSLTLSTLSRFNYSLKVADPVQAILSARRFLSRIQGYVQVLNRAFSLVAQQITRLSSFGVFGTNLVLGPMLSLVRGLLAVKSSITNFGPRVTRFATQLWDNIVDAAKQLVGLPPARFPLQDPLMNTLRRVQFVCAHILREPALNDSVAATTNDRRAQVVNRYSRGGGPRGQVQPPVTGGSSTFLGNEPIAGTVVEETVRVGETLRDIAQRCLDDRGRWHILAVMNDLRAPYISAVGGPGVLKAGDTLLCPTNGTGVRSSEIAPNNKSDRDTSNQDENKLGEVQQAYGRDLRLLTAQSGSDIDLTDLTVGQNGDLNTVMGIPNVEQALKLKFATERGELAVHPAYGSAFPIGTKATSSSFTTFQLDVRNTIASDPRISNVDQIRFSVFGDALIVDAHLRLLSSADVLSTSFALRRF